LTDIRLIAFDIDGTLTTGAIQLDAGGNEQKQFSVLDGLGFRLAEEADISVAVISGRSSKAVMARMSSLPEGNVLLGVKDKASALACLQSKLGVTREQTAFVGDDLNDIPAFSNAGLKIAVANADPQIKRLADYITTKSGGFGAGREAIEWILKRQGLYESAVQKYLERELMNV